MRIARGTLVHSSDGSEAGIATGVTRPCSMEGCLGQRVSVTWPKKPDQKRAQTTYPCSKGLDTLPDGSLKIIA